MMFAPFNGWLLNGGAPVLVAWASTVCEAQTEASFYVERYYDAPAVVCEATQQSAFGVLFDSTGLLLGEASTEPYDFRVIVPFRSWDNLAEAVTTCDALGERPFAGDVLAEAGQESWNAVLRTWFADAASVEAQGASWMDGLALRPFVGDELTCEAEADGYYYRWAGMGRTVFSGAISYVHGAYVYSFRASVRHFTDGAAPATGTVWGIHTHALLQTAPDDEPAGGYVDAYLTPLRDTHGLGVAEWDAAVDGTTHYKGLWGDAGPEAEGISEPDFIVGGVTYKRTSGLLPGETEFTISGHTRFARHFATAYADAILPDVLPRPERAMRGRGEARSAIPTTMFQWGIYGWADAFSYAEGTALVRYVDASAELVARTDPMELLGVSRWVDSRAVGIGEGASVEARLDGDFRRRSIVWTHSEAEGHYEQVNRRLSFRVVPSIAVATAEGRVVPRLSGGLSQARAVTVAGIGRGRIVESHMPSQTRSVAAAFGALSFRVTVDGEEMDVSAEAQARAVLNNYYPAPEYRALWVAPDDTHFTVPFEDRTFTV